MGGRSDTVLDVFLPSSGKHYDETEVCFLYALRIQRYRSSYQLLDHLYRYGFNPGSQLAIVPGYSAAVANAAVTTTLSPASAGLSALFASGLLNRGRIGTTLHLDALANPFLSLI